MGYDCVIAGLLGEVIGRGGGFTVAWSARTFSSGVVPDYRRGLKSKLRYGRSLC